MTEKCERCGSLADDVESVQVAAGRDYPGVGGGICPPEYAPLCGDCRQEIREADVQPDAPDLHPDQDPDPDVVGDVLGHTVAREIDGDDVRYRCVECGLSGVDVVPFDQYACDPRGRR